MLPKVATHILHTSRAAVTPLRNVLSTGSSGSSNPLGTRSGPAGSNWNGHGAGTGNTKQNTGNRYYSSFNNAGRAVSQANVVSANADGSFVNDENEDQVSRRVVVIKTSSQSQSKPPNKRPRSRSSSVSITKSESFGVLKTVQQLKARARFLHTHIQSKATIEAASNALDKPVPEPTPSSPTRPRRNSISSSDGLDRPLSPVVSMGPLVDDILTRSNEESLDEQPNRLRPRRNSTSSLDDFDQSDLASIERNIISSRPSTPPGARFPELISAKESQDPHRVAEAVAQFRATAKHVTASDFNLALEALYVTRHGESIIPMLETYNDMLKRSIQPDSQTYSLLILALTDRDLELARTIRNLTELKRRAGLFGEADSHKIRALQYRMDILASEQKDNFSSMMTLFYAANSTGLSQLPHMLYVQLLRTCSIHSNVGVALQVYRAAENAFKQLMPLIYRLMIQVHGNAGDIKGAETVFQHYVAAGKDGRIIADKEAGEHQRSHIQTWNAMIDAYFHCGLPDKAVGLLDQMMNSKAGIDFDLADVPKPCAATFTAVLSGFCETGDIQTAWVWYERLLQQGVETADSFTPSENPIKPDEIAATVMIEALAKSQMVSEMNMVYSAAKETLSRNQQIALIVYLANMQIIEQFDEATALKVLGFLRKDVLERITKSQYRQLVIAQVTGEYLKKGILNEALNAYIEFFDNRMKEIRREKGESVAAADVMSVLQISFGKFHSSFLQTVFILEETLEFRKALTLMQLSQILGVDISKKHCKLLLQSYAISKDQNTLPAGSLTLNDWELLLELAHLAERPNPHLLEIPGYAFGGILSLLEDFAILNVPFDSMSPMTVSKTIRHLVMTYGPNHVIGVLESLGPAFQRALENSEEIRNLVVGGRVKDAPQSVIKHERTQALMGSYGNLVVDYSQTRAVEDVLKHNNIRAEVIEAYNRVQQGLSRRAAPGLRTLGKLIQGLGRQSEIEKVKEVYTIAQDVLRGIQLSPELREGWMSVEDSMVIALAHAGDVDAAHVHRTRILQEGAAPSADAYGALILYVKDTTDDASNAMMLYREAQVANVGMNLYLYNNIISKLAKARKADHALELFHQMKAQGVRPSSITYGALIGACARVGDVQSAEALFQEMTEQKNFKARVPPYNTMMQLYTMTKPNRERALWFFEMMQKAEVKPTAHTYKLLLDAYGSIEPVDIVSMEAVFEQLTNDPNVAIQGTHYASLINAYGCVQRDLEKAITIFNDIPAHTSRSHTPGALDAVVFEAIINVSVSHRRMDLVPAYLTKMREVGIHMTAYVANYLIKGYAIAGEVEKAREVFESMQDPATGMAAPGNHASHDAGAEDQSLYLEAVYREPSTWEAMVRAELGNGHRERALDLLQRLKTRQYPEAVYNRISGVMVDHSDVV